MTNLHKILSEEKFFFQNNSDYNAPNSGIFTRYIVLDRDLPIWVNREGRLQDIRFSIKLENEYTKFIIAQNGKS